MSELVKTNFIEDFIEEALRQQPNLSIMTRFPPEPNGYLHIGHVKAICINFLTAKKYGGKCNLRMDDTNPAKEDDSYVQAIQKDIAWLGFQWHELCYGSDYFQIMYDCAVTLIKKGLAFVCDLSADEIKEYRGTLTEPGRNSPYRDRSVEENLQLFTEMKEGKYPDGAKVLRAKIDMASPNINMRDPVIFRILRAEHFRQGNTWCIYPMYDYAHPIEDAVEHITHSLCSLEFEDHRPLYDWVIDNLDFTVKPRQIEFARLNLTRTIMSKRYLKRLVDEGFVSGWDDPRMPTIAGLRRRGYTPAALIDFCDRIGVAKSNSEVDVALLEHCIREDLSPKVPRVMAVLDPIRVVITNYPEGQTEQLSVENPELGTRQVSFSREVYIDREDFMEEPIAKFFRLKPNGEVRLKGAYIIRCDEIIKNEDGSIKQLNCSYDPESKSGQSDRKVKGTLHWVNANDCTPVEYRLYDHLLMEGEGDFTERMNTGSKVVMNGFAERAIDDAPIGQSYQFLRQGYYCKDPDSTPVLPVFNRIVGLKDSWAKINK